MGLQWDKPSTNWCRISSIHSMSKCCRHQSRMAISCNFAIASSEPPTSMEISQEMPMVSCPNIVPRPTPMKRSKFFFNAAACALSRQVLGGTMTRSDPCQQPSTSNWVVVTHIDPKSSKTSRNHLETRPEIIQNVQKNHPDIPHL